MKPFDLLKNFWNDLDASTRLWCGYILIILLAVAVAWSSLNTKVQGVEKKRAARETVLKELIPLKVAYRVARQSSEQLNGRIASLRPDDSPAKVIEDIGIKGKSIKIAPAKGEERNGFVEDAAEIKIESITLNEAVNLLYRIEKGGRPILLKKVNLRIRFDDPARSDLTLLMALLKPVAGQTK